MFHTTADLDHDDPEGDDSSHDSVIERTDDESSIGATTTIIRGLNISYVVQEQDDRQHLSLCGLLLNKH